MTLFGSGDMGSWWNTRSSMTSLLSGKIVAANILVDNATASQFGEFFDEPGQSVLVGGLVTESGRKPQRESLRRSWARRFFLHSEIFFKRRRNSVSKTSAFADFLA